jgi:hypothetical protein
MNTDRIKEIQLATAHPESGSVYTALLKVWNETEQEQLRIGAVSGWVSYDWNKPETRPPKYGKYLITRKDGKIHWETWNGSGWAYNHNEIRFWAVIVPPCV